MKLLVISDYFYELSYRKTSDKIDYVQWSQYRNLPLRGRNCVLIDLTFRGDPRHPDTAKLLHDLQTQFQDRSLLANGILTVVVVCGANGIDIEYDEPYDFSIPNDNPEEKAINCYDFLRKIVPDEKSLKTEPNNDAHSLALMPISLYLDKYKNETSYLFYDFIPGAINSIGITPLATMLEGGNPCTAFECRVGGGVVVVLPPYNTTDYQDAFEQLLRICRSYQKQKEGVKELLRMSDDIPPLVRYEFAEALECFTYDLFRASVVMCRRTLEISAAGFNVETKHGNLKEIIDKLYTEGYIDLRLKKLAHIVRGFGNIGVHAADGVNLTEEDAISAIDFLKIYLESVYSLDERIKAVEARIKRT